MKDLRITLRLAAAMCFFGHGIFGIITKPIWCNYFGVFGIGHSMAYQLMPVVGTMDILMGLSLLVYPTRAVLGWLVGWGAFTALLRPLSGEPVAEAIERAGNYGAPLILLLLSEGEPWWSRLGMDSKLASGSASASGSVSELVSESDASRLNRAIKCLQIVVGLLLIGHGWLNWLEKKSLLEQYSTIGFTHPVAIAHSVGLFEMAAAIMLLIRPLRPVVLVLLVWKAGSELFYPQYEAFEWIERGGSYGCLLAFWLALGKQRSSTIKSNNHILTAL